MSAPALWTKHRGLARTIARDYYLPGSERQDVEQEALIGLWHASRQYDPGRGSSFPAFARMVIVRHLASCVRTATRGKALTLTDSAREIDMPYLHQITDRVDDREQLRLVLEAIDRDLTPIERRCVVGIASGLSYRDLGPDYRQVDNALMRGRKKLRATA